MIQTKTMTLFETFIDNYQHDIGMQMCVLHKAVNHLPVGDAVFEEAMKLSKELAQQTWRNDEYEDAVAFEKILSQGKHKKEAIEVNPLSAEQSASLEQAQHVMFSNYLEIVLSGSDPWETAKKFNYPSLVIRL